MATWFISTAGSDETGDGTELNPYLTINKGLDSASNGDTIYLVLTHSTYVCNEPIYITKEVEISSNGYNEVWVYGIDTIFIIQSNNVIIRNILFQADGPIIMVDPMSTGLTPPTFWSGITIDNCDFSYKTTALDLCGKDIYVTNCGFSFRYEDFMEVNVTIINLYGLRGICSIHDNYISSWMYPTVRYINITSKGDVEGDYFDKCNSKGGTLNIYNNNGYYTLFSADTPSTFINMDYFNQYNYVTGPDIDYNPNTRLTLNIYENVVQFVVINSNLVNIDNKSNSDYATFNKVNIYNNSLNTTNFGALHLGKQVNGSKLTIDQIDLERNIFKVYGNTLVYPDPVVNKVFQWDASNRASMRDADNNELQINGSLSRWIDSIGNIDITNGADKFAILEQEERGGTTYTYIRTPNDIGGFLQSAFGTGIFKVGYTIYLVFREADSANCPGYGVYPFVKMESFNAMGFCKYNNNSANANSMVNGSTYGSGDEYKFIPSYSVKSEFLKNVQVWALNCDNDKWTYVYNTDSEQNFINSTYTGGYIPQQKFGITQPLLFGYSSEDPRFSSSMCLYEIVIYDGVHYLDTVDGIYRDLQFKWGIRTNMNEIHIWDTNYPYSIVDENGQPVALGNPITIWNDVIGNVNMVNAGSYPAVVGSEERGGNTYIYIKTISNTLGYLITETPVIQSGYTIFIVFRESDDPIAGTADRVFMNDENNALKCAHGSDDQGYVNNENINDYQTGRYGVRVWAIEVNGDIPYRCIFPSAGATSFGRFKNLTTTTTSTLNKLKLGQIDDNFPSSICLYEIRIYDSILSDDMLMDTYTILYNKWRVIPPTIPVKVFNFDASASSSILDEGGNPVVAGNPITKWVDTVSQVNMVNGGINKAILDSEVRNTVTYNFIRTINNVNGYLCTVDKTITKLCTMYVVFREADTIYDINVGTQLACTQYLNGSEYFMDLQHLSGTGSGYWNSELPDTQSTSFTTRIWAIRIEGVNTSTVLVPNAGDVQNPVLYPISGFNPFCSTPRHLFFGKTSNRTVDDKPSSICLYEVRIYDGLHSDPEMLAEYNSLGIKWGIINPP